MPLGHFWINDFALKEAKEIILQTNKKKIIKTSQLKISFVVSFICEHDTKQICSDLGSILV